MKRNIPILGFFIGLLCPLIGIFIVYLILFNNTTFSSFLSEMTHNFDGAAKVLSLGLLINLAPFSYYTYNRLDLTARGILISTVLYAVLMVLLKFVW